MKKNILILALVIVMCICTIACSTEQSPIVGKWTGVTGGVEIIVEFKNNGTVTITSDTSNMSGTYTFDESTMSVEMASNGMVGTGKLVGNDTLTLVDENLNSMYLTRVK